EDEVFSPQRRGGARFVLAGMAAVLLLAAAAIVLVDAPVRERLLAVVVEATGAETPFDDAALYAALHAERREELASALESMTTRYERASGRERARAAAYASMLASARVRQESAQAPPPSEPDTPPEISQLRVQAYKLASEARALAGDLPEAHLAMASYQAARGARIEAEADLAALDAALGNSRRSDEEKRRLREEAAAQRALLVAPPPPKASTPDDTATTTQPSTDTPAGDDAEEPTGDAPASDG